MQSTIHDIQIDFEFFDAIYGKKLLRIFNFLNLSRQFAGLCDHELGPSELGCWLSHMIIWQRLAQGDYTAYDRIIIIEDDVIFKPNIYSRDYILYYRLILHSHS